jgi:hypothetical protein
MSLLRVNRQLTTPGMVSCFDTNHLDHNIKASLADKGRL